MITFNDNRDRIRRPLSPEVPGYVCADGSRHLYVYHEETGDYVGSFEDHEDAVRACHEDAEEREEFDRFGAMDYVLAKEPSDACAYWTLKPSEVKRDGIKACGECSECLAPEDEFSPKP